MQFKSERFWSGSSAKFFAATSVAALIAFGIFSRVSSAAITLHPVNVNGTILGNVQNDSFYYPYLYTTTQQVFGAMPAASPTPIPTFGTIATGYSFVDLGQDPNTNSSNVSTQNGVIYFSILSTVTSSNPIAIAATIVTGATGTTATYLVPITSVNGAFCNPSSCVLGPQGSFGGVGGGYYYGADYGQGSTTIVGISPQSICKSVSAVAGGAVASGCEDYPWANLTNPTALTAMPINFNIYNQSDLQTAISTTPFVAPSAAPLDTNYPVNMEFETLSPVVNPSPNPSPTPNEICTFVDGSTYTPQQGGLTINSTTQVFNVTGDPDGLGPNQIYVIAAQSPTPLNSLASPGPGNYLNNVIATPVPAAQSPSDVIGGFTNSTDASNPIFYTLGFLAEDAAGFVFDAGSSPNSCVLPGPFDTSAVQGFLNESKCFIATAAFRSLDTAPLVLLRSFRDNFLEHFGLGKSFVHWYYGWSPDAAEWLIDHPTFRFPVLLALIPLQVFAWVVLHPLLLLLLFMGSLVVLALSFISQSGESIGRPAE